MTEPTKPDSAESAEAAAPAPTPPLDEGAGTVVPIAGLLDPHLRKVVLTIGYMLIVAGFAYALSVVWPVIAGAISICLPFLVALIIAYILNPIVTFLCVRLKLQRIGGLLMFYLLVLLVAGALLGIVLPILYEQSRAAFHGITQTVPEHVNNFLVSKNIDPAVLWQQVDDFLRANGIDTGKVLVEASQSEGVQQALKSATTGSLILLTGILGGVLKFVKSILSSITFLVFVILISFYFIVDFAKFRGIAQIMIPDEFEDRAFRILGKVDQAVGGFLRGQIISATLVGILVMIGLTFLGMGKYALLIGVIAIIGNLIPYLGPILAGAPAVAYMILSDAHDSFQDKMLWAAITAGVFIFIQQIDGFIFQPKIVGKAAQLHPVAIILALVAGSNFGIMGMIVAVPIASIARVLLKEFYWDKREIAWRELTGKKRLEDPS
jgi:predicted PurR-regulated permease PerM